MFMVMSGWTDKIQIDILWCNPFLIPGRYICLSPAIQDLGETGFFNFIYLLLNEILSDQALQLLEVYSF